MATEDGDLPREPVLVSAIEHWSYCPRQCGLIHLESIWDENLFTLKGARAHRRVDEDQDRVERGKRVLRALPIWSERYGLVGQADVVEITPALPPYRDVRPVEYKVGPKTDQPHARLQACAQALCLEEMFGLVVEHVDVYFVQTKDRVSHPVTPELRAEVVRIVAEIRAMLDGSVPPPPVADKRCRNCSLIDACQPFALAQSAARRAEGLYTLLPLRELP